MILKVSKSGKGIVIVDDFGNTYSTSKQYLLSLVSGRMRAPFIQLTRMPMPAEMGRFKPSSILGKGGEHIDPDDDAWRPPQCSHNVEVDRGKDAGISQQQIKKREKKKVYTDKVVW